MDARIENVQKLTLFPFVSVKNKHKYEIKPPRIILKVGNHGECLSDREREREQQDFQIRPG